jgi:hypothetical protein
MKNKHTNKLNKNNKNISTRKKRIMKGGVKSPKKSVNAYKSTAPSSVSKYSYNTTKTDREFKNSIKKLTENRISEDALYRGLKLIIAELDLPVKEYNDKFIYFKIVDKKDNVNTEYYKFKGIVATISYPIPHDEIYFRISGDPEPGIITGVVQFDSRPSETELPAQSNPFKKGLTTMGLRVGL